MKMTRSKKVLMAILLIGTVSGGLLYQEVMAQVQTAAQQVDTNQVDAQLNVIAQEFNELKTCRATGTCSKNRIAALAKKIVIAAIVIIVLYLGYKAGTKVAKEAFKTAVNIGGRVIASLITGRQY